MSSKIKAKNKGGNYKICKSLKRLRLYTHTHTHTPYVYKNVCKLIKRVQKNNLRNKVVLVSVSEKARKVEKGKRIKSIMEDSKDSVLHYGIKQAEMLVLV